MTPAEGRRSRLGGLATGAVAGVVVGVAAVLTWPRMPLGWLLTVHLFAYVCFFALVVLLRKDAAVGAPLVWSAGGVLIALAVARPPAQSHDLWSYLFYGRIAAVYHRSPYRLRPSAFANDPWFSRVDPAWRQARSVYGGLFTWVSAAIARMAGSSALFGRLLFQGLAAAAVVASAVIVQRVTRSAAAAAVLILNPLVIVSIVNGGHNDALVGFGVLVAAICARRQAFLAAGAALGAAALVKLSALLVGFGLLLWILQHRGRRAAAATALALIVVTGAGTWLAGGSASVAPLEEASSRISAATVWNPMARELVIEDVAEHVPASRANASATREIARITPIALVAALVVVALATRSGEDVSVPALTSIAAYVLLGTYVLPWYVGWGLPLVAVTLRSRRTLILLGYSAVLHLAYVPRYEGAVFFGGHSLTAAIQRDVRTVAIPALATALVVWTIVAAARRLRPGLPGLARSEPAG